MAPSPADEVVVDSPRVINTGLRKGTETVGMIVTIFSLTNNSLPTLR